MVIFLSVVTEGRVLPHVEKVPNDAKDDQGKDDANYCPSSNIHRVMGVTYPGEADPKCQNDHGKLDKGSEDLENPVGEPDSSIAENGRKVAEPCLKIDDDEHGTIETERGMPREKRQSCLMQLFLGSVAMGKPQANSVFILCDKPAVPITV